MIDNGVALTADGLDDAIVGVGSRCGQPDLFVYDVEKVIEILVKQGMAPEEAWEWFDYNIGGAWMGEGTPIWLDKRGPLP